MNPKKQENLQKALLSLEEALSLPIRNQRDIAGIIQNFEFTYELSWKFLKAYLADRGTLSTTPKDTLSKAYQQDLISDEQTWLDIIEDRNLSVHTYDETLAKQLVERIQKRYIDVFLALKTLFINQ